MGSSTSVTTENPEPRRRPGFLSIQQPRPAAADSEAATFNERRHRGPWPSEVPPTGVLTEVLDEMAFYYGASCHYHRSAPPRQGKTQ